MSLVPARLLRHAIRASYLRRIEECAPCVSDGWLMPCNNSEEKALNSESAMALLADGDSFLFAPNAYVALCLR